MSAARNESSRAASSSPRRRSRRCARLTVEAVGLAEPLLDGIEHPRRAADLLRRHALEVERVHQHVPATVDLADEVRGRDLDAVEERLAERPAAERRERPHLDPGRVDRADEHRDAAMLGVAVGADGEVDPVGELGARRPDLVAGDDVGVAAKLRPRRQRAEIAPRARLGEALAEDELAARDRRQQPLHERGASAKRSIAAPIVLYERRYDESGSQW